jgi:bifunctional DNA-binding transcriptional regulator/antitoxin component of YhaV-PrlF toxin-antitoxin module
MTKRIKMDRAGRIVIPLWLREKYGLDKASHQLEIFETAEGIGLRPTLEEIPAERDESGWIVFRSDAEEGADPSRAVEQERERRIGHVRGDE